tara:strand:+ start:3778 stop:4176 length:399 start_codon:yes stop_codon:yes gene_type:complete
MPSRIPTFLHPIVISPQNIDHMGHVNNAVYLQWVHEAVVSYWSRRAPEQAQSELLWVALKHEINYRLPLYVKDDAEAFVTAAGSRGSRATFTTEFKRGNDLIAEARSVWCCVNAETRRPRRIDPEIADVFLT